MRRELRDDMYKMICSYDGDGKVSLKNMGAFGNACFCLGMTIFLFPFFLFVFATVLRSIMLSFVFFPFCLFV